MEHSSSITTQKKSGHWPISDTILHMSPLQRLLASILLLVAVVTGTILLHEKNKDTLIEIPGSGGTLTEGIVGTPRFINPILAVSKADQDLVSVVYAGLMTRDKEGTLIPELARGYEVSEDGTQYTFTLKDNVVFHDNIPLTADDVVFTVQQAANSALYSPLFADWEGIQVEAENQNTVVFTLPEPYAPFLENTTLGILPKHIWENLTDNEFAFSQFNTEPIGAGPYMFTKMTVDKTGIPETYELHAFEAYPLGTPSITQLIFALYRDEESRLKAFSTGAVQAIHNVSPSNIETLTDSELIPPFSINRVPQLRVFGIFFNHNKQPLFLRDEVREALRTATPKQAIVGDILNGYGTVLDAPIPPHIYEKVATSSIGTGDSDTNTASTSYITIAREILEDARWERNEETGIYEREIDEVTTPLSFTLSTVDVPELTRAAERIAESWRELGADVEIKVYDTTDLTQSIIRPRKHEALFFGIEVGHELDLYVFWHSSQRNDPGLNISQFTDIELDATLEKLRTEREDTARTALLSTFVDIVTDKTTSIPVYTPDFTYLTRDSLKNVTLHPIANPSERFDTIHEWYIETDLVWPVVKDLIHY